MDAVACRFEGQKRRDFSKRLVKQHQILFELGALSFGPEVDAVIVLLEVEGGVLNKVVGVRVLWRILEV